MNLDAVITLDTFMKCLNFLGGHSLAQISTLGRRD
jgi:hypothetical protein